MTNIVNSISGAAYTINWTMIIAILTVSLTTMATLIKIFSNKVKEEDLRDSSYIKSIDNKSDENNKKIEILKELFTEEKTKVVANTVEIGNDKKTIETLKQDNRELVQRLDDLLKQLLEWFSNYES